MSVRPADFPPPFGPAEFVAEPTDPPDERIDVGVLVIGGGPAGLQAALTLGRIHREAVLFDDGTYRNATVSHMHNVVAHDGTKVALSSCLVADVRAGKITKLYEYMDSGQFRRPRR